MIKVALISGGRESTAMVKKVEDEFGKDFFDEKMFANTGDDPHGVATIEHLEKYCGWKVTTGKSKHFPIVKYYEDAHVIDKLDVKDSGHAMPFHAQKDCSTKFKITPVRNYLREKYGKKEKFEIYYGFSFSKKEVERKMRVTKPEYQVGYATYKFPLIDMKIDRKLCGLNGVPLRKLFGLEPLDKEQKKLFDTYTPEKIDAIMDTEILTKKISVGCNCMEDVRIFDKVDVDE